MIVGFDVKSIARDIDVNNIATIFGLEKKNIDSSKLLYPDNIDEINPRYLSVLTHLNHGIYTNTEDLSGGKGTEISVNDQNNLENTSENVQNATLCEQNIAKDAVYTGEFVQDKADLESRFPSELPNKYYDHVTLDFKPN